MPRYRCPECKAVIERSEPVPAGKRLRCPKCETVFAPQAKAKPKEEPLPIAIVEDDGQSFDAKKIKPIDGTDDANDRQAYGVIHEKEEEKEVVEYGELRGKFAVSYRGPALALVTEPANFLVGAGLATAVLGCVGVFVSIFPFVYSTTQMSGGEVRHQILQAVGCVVVIIWGILVCVGSSRMQTLESSTWAWIGAVMGVFPLLFGIFAIVVLCDPIVKTGFEETQSNPDYRRRREE